jgi:hypothetical protein
MVLNWSEEQEPNNEIRYNHISAETPLGIASIEWKGWKNFPDFSVFINGEYIDSCGTLAGGKIRVQCYLLEKAKQIQNMLNTMEQPRDQI